jgi:hypothetical protein
VAAFGERPFIATTVCAILTILNIAALIAILRRLDVPEHLHFWLITAFFFGSGYWFALSFSEGVWYSASIVAVTGVLLALCESMTRDRGWVIGLGLSLAFLSRQFTIFAVPLLIASPLQDGRRETVRGLRWYASAACPLLVAGVLYLLFDRVRFGSVWETGYRYLPLDGYELARRDQYGLFSLAYVPVNLFHLLLHGFTITFSSSDQLGHPQPDWFGTALPAASPFVLLAFFAPISARTRWLWVTIVAMAFAHSTYYVSGAGQLNWQRYALDYWPVLFLLIGLGFRAESMRGHATLWKAAIVYAVVLNALLLAWFDVAAFLLRDWFRLFSMHVG